MLRMLLSRRTHLLPMNSTQHSSVPLAFSVHRHSPSFLPGTQTMLLAPCLFVSATRKISLVTDFPSNERSTVGGSTPSTMNRGLLL
jgi:hypothetical protein